MSPTLWIEHLKENRPASDASEHEKAIWARDFLTANWLRCSAIAAHHRRELTFALGTDATTTENRIAKFESFAHAYANSAHTISDIFGISEDGQVWDDYHTESAK